MVIDVEEEMTEDVRLKTYKTGGDRLKKMNQKKHTDLLARYVLFFKEVKVPVSIKDISRLTGISRPTVKNHLQEAIKLSGRKFKVMYFGAAKVLVPEN